MSTHNLKNGSLGEDGRSMREDLISLLTPELRERVLSGEFIVQDGQNPAKPVVRTKGGKLVKGSGRFPNANDPALVGKKTAYKKSKTYREALEALVPVDGDATRYGSFAWWLAQGFSAAEGSPQQIQCPCGCNYRGLYAFKKDGQLIFKLVELLAGKARETQDLNIRSESLIAVLNERIPTHEITVHTIDPGEAQKRRLMLQEGS